MTDEAVEPPGLLVDCETKMSSPTVDEKLAAAPTYGNDEANEAKSKNHSLRDPSCFVEEDEVRKHSGVGPGLSGFAGALEETETPVDSDAENTVNVSAGVNEDGPYHSNVNSGCDPSAIYPVDSRMA